jgi:hypothetical protein
MNRRITDAAIAAFIFGLFAGLALAVPATARADLEFNLDQATFAPTGDGGLIVHGKIYVRYQVLGMVNAATKVLDTAKAYTPASYQRLPSCKVDPAINCPTGPVIDVMAWKTCNNDPAIANKSTCPMKEIGRVANFTHCDAPIIKPPNYRLVSATNGKTGMTVCTLVPGQLRLQSMGWVSAEKYQARFFPDEKPNAADFAIFALPSSTALDAPAATPPSAPSGVNAGANDYTFYCKSDDGCRVWVNNVLVVDNWKQQASIEASGAIALAPGKYPLKIEYFDATGGAEVHLAYSSGAIAKQIVPAGKLSAFAGQYFNAENFTGAAMQRLDANVDFNWGAAAPIEGIAADHFSVRWLGDITVP